MCSSAPLPPIRDFTPYYKLFPMGLSDSIENETNLNPAQLHNLFPSHLQDCCVLALLAAATEAGTWSGASWAYLDRIAIQLAHAHKAIMRKRLWRFVRSIGRDNQLTAFDVLVWFTQSFREVFWGSMKQLMRRRWVRVQHHVIGDREWEVFFPTPRLIREINDRMKHGVPATNP